MATGTKGGENKMLGNRDPGEGGFAGFRALPQMPKNFMTRSWEGYKGD